MHCRFLIIVVSMMPEMFYVTASSITSAVIVCVKLEMPNGECILQMTNRKCSATVFVEFETVLANDILAFASIRDFKFD